MRCRKLHIYKCFRKAVVYLIIFYLFKNLSGYFYVSLENHTRNENDMLTTATPQEGGTLVTFQNMSDEIMKEKSLDCPAIYYRNRKQTMLLHTISTLLNINVTIPFFLSAQSVQNVDNTLEHMTYILSSEGIKLSFIFQKHIWPDLNVNNLPEYTLMLYLAMCDVSNSIHFIEKYSGYYYLISGEHCFMSASTKDKMQHKDRSESALMQSDVLCKLKCAPILIQMDDISSNVSSLGIKLMKLKQSFEQYKLSGEEMGMILEEMDGRIGRVVSFLRENCEMYKENPRKSDIHRALESASIISLVPEFKSSSVSSRITVEGGYTGYVKMIHPSNFKTYQGASEILAHWVDRIIGSYRTPVVVTRKLYLTQFSCTKWQTNGHDCMPKNITSLLLPGMVKPNKKIPYHYRRAVRYDNTTKSYFVYVCIIATIKDAEFSGAVMTIMTAYRRNIRGPLCEYFGHWIDYRDLRHKIINISKQRLRDISDISIFDFITVNEDRIQDVNWVLSGTRLINFDNGISFHPFRTGGLRNFTSTFRYLFCNTMPKEKRTKQNNFCRFNRDMIIKLEKVGPKADPHKRLGQQFQVMLEQEAELSKCESFNSEKTKEQSINSRVEAVLNLHNACFETYGKSIYI